MGNPGNYGFRTLACDHGDLYMGMANPSNISTDPTDDIPDGGWELIRMRRRSLLRKDLVGDRARAR